MLRSVVAVVGGLAAAGVDAERLLLGDAVDVAGVQQDLTGQHTHYLVHTRNVLGFRMLVCRKSQPYT